MSNDTTDLFALAERRLGWLDRRQGLLAQNIANANTPGYLAKDLSPFAQILAQSTPDLLLTHPSHIGGVSNIGGPNARPRPTEKAPDGNAVSMEEQLTKVADTDGAHSLVTTLYHKYLGFFHTVIGK